MIYLDLHDTLQDLTIPFIGDVAEKPLPMAPVALSRMRARCQEIVKDPGVTWPKGCISVAKAIGMHGAKMPDDPYYLITNYSDWYRKPKTHWADELVQIASRIDPQWCVLSAGRSGRKGRSHVEDAGTNWLYDNYEITADRVIWCMNKSLLCRPGDILVDDNQANIEDWESAGGVGILVPAPWNAGAIHYGNAIGAIVSQFAYHDMVDSIQSSEAWKSYRKLNSHAARNHSYLAEEDADSI